MGKIMRTHRPGTPWRRMTPEERAYVVIALGTATAFSIGLPLLAWWLS